jgi:hypothetical protein
MSLMTREEFIAYAVEATSEEALEPLYETIDQHNGEVAQFGDSWPGAIPQIQADIAEVKRIERQLARLVGREPRNFHFSVRHPN